MLKTFRTRGVLFVVLAALLCLPVMLRAREADRPKVVVVGGAAYILDTPVQIVAGVVQEYSISPDGRHVVVVSGSPATPEWRDLSPPPPKRFTHTLSLYETRTGRTRVLRMWNDSEAVSRQLVGTAWLADSDTAIFKLLTLSKGGSPFEPVVDLILVHCSRASMQIVPLPVGQPPVSTGPIHPSPTRPQAIVSFRNAVTGKVALRVLSAKGVLGTTVDADGEDFEFNGWNKTGDAILLSRYVEGIEEIEGHHEYAVWNRATGVSTPLKSRPPYKDYDFSVPEYNALVTPLRLITERGETKTASGAKSSVSCVVAVGADGKERVVVATDAEAATVVGKPQSPTLIYQQHDALYAVPVRSVTETAYNEYLRKEAESSVKQIGLSISMYSQDYDEQLPLASHDVAKDLSPYLKSETSFLDARNGVNAFTYTYTGVGDAAGRKPLFTFQTTTGIYRAFWMPDGNVITEPPIDAPKP